MGRNPMSDGSAGSRKGAIVAAVAALIFVGFVANNARLVANINKADDQVVTWKNKLSTDRDDAGRWKQWPSELPEKDPWGNPIRVLYERDKHVVRLTVSSDGPDRKQWSSDDIKASESDTDWMGMAKESVEEVAGAASRGTVGGAIDGVTDRIREARRRRKEEGKK